ncbi:MAG: enamine deaminase RidA (YjgF/YER057c/UK114 family) [Crocinitomix sp.]|jgi:enamine deaminase RidA (YjgF/YER057c/UK114 family)
MERKRINSGSTFEEEVAYSRAIVDGDWIFVSGTTGFDYSTMTIDPSIEKQTEQCFENIITALKEANAELSDTVRVLYILPDATEFNKTWPVLRKYFGDIRPAATMFSAGLADARMKIEIQVTARKQSKT